MKTILSHCLVSLQFSFVIVLIFSIYLCLSSKGMWYFFKYRWGFDFYDYKTIFYLVKDLFALNGFESVLSFLSFSLHFDIVFP